MNKLNGKLIFFLSLSLSPHDDHSIAVLQLQRNHDVYLFYFFDHIREFLLKLIPLRLQVT